MTAWAKSTGIDFKIVLTKSDKLSNNELAKQRSVIASVLEVGPSDLIAASAMTKKGVDQVRREIISRL